MRDKLEIFQIMMVLTLGSFFVSALGGFSLVEELEWYGRPGYNISELDYDLFVEYYEGFKLNVRESSLNTSNIFMGK